MLPPRSTSGLAIGSFVCGLFWAGGLGSIAALILGYLSLREIRRNPLRISGRAMAIAGIVLGWLGVVGLLVIAALGMYFWRLHKQHPDEQLRQATVCCSTSASRQSAAFAWSAIRVPAPTADGCSSVVTSQVVGSLRTTAELASYGIAQKQPDGPKLVKGQEPETLDKAAAVSEPMPLFSESEMGDFRSQWSKVQTGFVDEPRRTVEDADKLVAAVMQRLAEGFANERSGLEKQWDSGDNVSTEDLRVALQRYRSFFDRLLKL